MGGEAAAHRELRLDVLEVLQVPALVGVREDEVERPGELLHELVRVGEPRVDEGRDARLLEVAQRLGVARGVDLDGGELSPGLAQPPRDPDRRVAGRGADLERPRVAVLDHEVVEDLPVHPRHVHVAPLAAVSLQEAADLLVEGPVLREGGRSHGDGQGGESGQAHGHLRDESTPRIRPRRASASARLRRSLAERRLGDAAHEAAERPEREPSAGRSHPAGLPSAGERHPCGAVSVGDRPRVARGRRGPPAARARSRGAARGLGADPRQRVGRGRPGSRGALRVALRPQRPPRPRRGGGAGPAGGAGRARPGRPRARRAPGGDGHLLLPRPGGRVLRGRGRRHVRGGRPRAGRGPRGPPAARAAPRHGGPAGRASSRAPAGEPAMDGTGGPQLRPLALERRRDPPRRAAHPSSHPRAPPVRVRIGRGGRS